MKQHIFINLKRFEVAKKLGGLCSFDDPVLWIQNIVRECFELNIFREDIRVVFFVPEGLIHATALLAEGNFYVGSQGVFRENISPGGNFGAFTTNLPAAAAKSLGCSWSIIGHSEERQDKLGIMSAFESRIGKDPILTKRAKDAVNYVINQEVLRALESGLDVLLCVGETEEEQGEGTFVDQKPRIKKVLRNQLIGSLRDVSKHLDRQELVIGYEPIWAIGPGKESPDKEYISFVTQFIKEVVFTELGVSLNVVYGGGLKKENASLIGSIPALDGGLIALTRFTGEIGFEPADLKEIIEEYIKGDFSETS